MKFQDQLYLEEAYTAISESDNKFPKNYQSFITKYDKIVEQLKNNEIDRSEMMTKHMNLLMEIMRWMKGSHSSSEKVMESTQDYSSLSDSKLLDLYKDEFDKQFEGQEDKEKLKKIHSAIKSRGVALTNKASAYAAHKTEMER